MHILRDKSVKTQISKFMLTKFKLLITKFMLSKIKLLNTARWHKGKKWIMLRQRSGIETFQGHNFFQLNKSFYKVKMKFTRITLK